MSNNMCSVSSVKVTVGRGNSAVSISAQEIKPTLKAKAVALIAEKQAKIKAVFASMGVTVADATCPKINVKMLSNMGTSMKKAIAKRIADVYASFGLLEAYAWATC